MVRHDRGTEKKLLVVAALGEVAFGVFVFVAPRLALALFFGSEPVASAVIMTRILGVAVVGLGVACYPGGPRQGLYGFLTYSFLVVLYLIAVGISGAAGMLLWLAVVVHTLLSALLIVAARRN